MIIRKYLKNYKFQKRNKSGSFMRKTTIPKNPYKLHEAIKDDVQFWQESYFTKEDIVGKIYTPYSLQDVPVKAYDLIAQIGKYFNCIVIWDRVMVPGTNEGLNTVSVYGYPLSQHLCFYYISMTLASLDYLKYYVAQWKRKDRRRKNRRGYKKKPQHMTSTQMGERYYDLTLERTINSWKDINKERSREHLRLYEIFKYVDNKRGLNFRKYHYKDEPKMINAIATKGKFQFKRIIYETE